MHNKKREGGLILHTTHPIIYTHSTTTVEGATTTNYSINNNLQVAGRLSERGQRLDYGYTRENCCVKPEGSISSAQPTKNGSSRVPSKGS